MFQHDVPRPDPVEVEVEISDTQGHLAVDRAALTTLARAVLAAEGVGRASVSIALVDDATIHVLNRRHLGHDWPTDVITFALSGPGEPELAGELVVSTEMASAVARRAGAAPWHELALYVVHGLLHLCGYDDESVPDREAMRRREAEILAGQGLSNTFPLLDLGEAAGAERESVRWSV